MFNFRSLAAMIDDEVKEDDSAHIENIQNQGDITHDYHRGQSSSRTCLIAATRATILALNKVQLRFKQVTSAGYTGNVTIDPRT
jgi:predicted ATP-grasp superfamily ATP-dependent carboligase